MPAGELRPFLFSCDAHIAEPPDLFTSRLPPHLQRWAIHGAAEGKYRITKIGDEEVHKVRVDFHIHKTGLHDPHAQGLAEGASEIDTKRRGARDLQLRVADMDRDGVDAELVFPSLGLILPRIPDREGQVESCKIWNDWAWEYTAPVRDRLIPSAMIPCIDFEDALAEVKRTIAMGYASVTLWEGLNNYNSPDWDPIFAYAGEHNVPLAFHTGLGAVNIRFLSGPGAAMYNYTRQMNDAVDIIAQLVAGGVLDRNPTAHILFAEHSAGWLWGLAERMDEIYVGHAPAVHPKLGRMPSQIIREQVHCALQNDVGSLATRHGVGVNALLFATDYPHSEGTFPFSQKVVDRMMAENADATLADFVAVLGGNAARIFKRANLEAKVEERARALETA
jgi:predicted TIM-barrel fold metal-dependent hydrolase